MNAFHVSPAVLLPILPHETITVNHQQALVGGENYLREIETVFPYSFEFSMLSGSYSPEKCYAARKVAHGTQANGKVQEIPRWNYFAALRKRLTIEIDVLKG
jgi:hypothetical protein